MYGLSNGMTANGLEGHLCCLKPL